MWFKIMTFHMSTCTRFNYFMAFFTRTIIINRVISSAILILISLYSMITFSISNNSHCQQSNNYE